MEGKTNNIPEERHDCHIRGLKGHMTPLAPKDSLWRILLIQSSIIFPDWRSKLNVQSYSCTLFWWEGLLSSILMENILKCPSGADFPWGKQRWGFLPWKRPLPTGTSTFDSGGAHRAQPAGGRQHTLAKTVFLRQQFGGGGRDGLQRWSNSRGLHRRARVRISVSQQS